MNLKPMLVRWLLNALALLITAALFGGIHVNGLWAALVAGAVLGITNTFIRPVLFVMTLPLNLLTLGLFTLVINAFMLQLTDFFVGGFRVDSFMTALLGSVILGLVGWFLNAVVPDEYTR